MRKIEREKKFFLKSIKVNECSFVRKEEDDEKMMRGIRGWRERERESER